MINHQQIQAQLNDEIALRLGRALIDSISDKLTIQALAAQVAALEPLDRDEKAEGNQGGQEG